MTRARLSLGGIGLLGGLVALVGAWRTGWYTPVWLEDLAPCQLAGRCTQADVQAGLRRLWWPVGGGLAVLALAAVLLAWTLPLTWRRAADHPRPAPVHALLAGLLAFGAALLAGVPLLVAAFGGYHLLTVALTGVWLVQAVVLLLPGRLARSVLTTPRHEWLAALLVSALGAGAVVLTWAAEGTGSLTALPVVDAVVVAAAVLAQRSLQALRRGPAWPSLAGGVAVLAAGALLLVELIGPAPSVPAGARPVPVPPVVPAPTPSAVPTPTPAPTATPTAVSADVPCAQQDLAFRVVGFDGAMGARAASIQATNTGTAACWVAGVPVVVLLQGGRPLVLQVGPGETPEDTPAQGGRVDVAPRGAAYALLTWRTYGGWADAETPQALTVALDASSSLVDAALPAGSGPAPFDIADGGAWGVAPWAAPRN